MVRLNPSANEKGEGIGETFRDRLVPYLNPESEVARAILHQGYCVIPSILSTEEADEEYDRMWAFISKIRPGIRRNSSSTWMKPTSNEKEDPWPCAQRDVCATVLFNHCIHIILHTYNHTIYQQF
jgi:hypothetical protein